MKEKKGARDRIREFFEQHVGEIVTTNQIAEVAKIMDYQRRIRELRNDEGMQIQSYRDNVDLKPNEYLLVSEKRIPNISREISYKLRTEILERNGYTCQICGATANDPDPTDPRKKLRLEVDHIVPVSLGGKNTKDNLRVLCSACNHGKSNITEASESAKSLLARIRKAPRSVQHEVFLRLKTQFEKTPQ